MRNVGSNLQIEICELDLVFLRLEVGLWNFAVFSAYWEMGEIIKNYHEM